MEAIKQVSFPDQAAQRNRMRRLSICLINPRFEPSFCGLEHMMPLLPGDKRV